MDTNIIGVGDVITWTIETNIVKEKNIHFPDLVDVDNNLSILDQKSIFKDKTIIGKKFEIVCWDTGSFSLQTIQLMFLKVMEFSIIN